MTIIKALVLTIVNAFFVAVFTQIFISEWFHSFLTSAWSTFTKVSSVVFVVSLIVLFCVLMTQMTMLALNKILKGNLEKFVGAIAKYHSPTMKKLRRAKTVNFILILSGYLISSMMILISLSVANAQI